MHLTSSVSRAPGIDCAMMPAPLESGIRVRTWYDAPLHAEITIYLTPALSLYPFLPLSTRSLPSFFVIALVVMAIGR